MFNIHKKQFSLIIFLLLSPILASAQTFEAFVRDSLDNYISKAMAQWQVPGAAVCIVKDGKILLAKGYGVKDIDKKDPVDANTIFLIGSNTKAFTGTALALLENEEKCNLNDKVQKWLPDFSMKDKWVASEMDLTDLVTHRIGMRTFQGDFIFWGSALSEDEVIEKFGRLTPQYSFRSRWGYTNAGYTIAAACIKQISGKSWAAFMKERFFVPLEMNNTHALTAATINAENTAKPHSVVEGKLQRIPFREIDNLAAAASIGSTATDMSHWVMMQLDSGRYKGESIIPYQAIVKTRYPQTITGRLYTKDGSGHFRLYGLGWFMEDYLGKEIISHGGAVNGFLSSVTLIPEINVGIVILTNSDVHSFYESMKRDLMDVALGVPSHNYNQTYYQGFEKGISEEMKLLNAWKDTVEMNFNPEMPLKNYAGTYENAVYGNMELKESNGQLIATFEHHPDLTGTLESLGGNRFLCTYSDPALGVKVFPFKTEKNKITSVTVSVSGFIDYANYEFIKKK